MFSQVTVYSFAIWIITRTFAFNVKTEPELTSAQIITANKRQNMFDEHGDLSRCIKVVHRENSETNERKANALDSSSMNILRAVRRYRSESPSENAEVGSAAVDDVQDMLNSPQIGAALQFFMGALDAVVDAPFVYLAKKADPISLINAIDYICENELTNKIYVVHICDDRTALGMYNEFSRQAQEQMYRGSMSRVEIENRSDKFLLQMFSKEHDGETSGYDSNQRSYFDTLPATARELCKYTHTLDSFYA